MRALRIANGRSAYVARRRSSCQTSVALYTREAHEMATRHIGVTHVGSLPRGDELVPLLLAKDHGKPYDAGEFERTVQSAIDDAVKKQVAAGDSIVSDGELGKVGYSTYVTERLEGFGGQSTASPRSIWRRIRRSRKSLPRSWAAGVHSRRLRRPHPLRGWSRRATTSAASALRSTGTETACARL